MKTIKGKGGERRERDLIVSEGVVTEASALSKVSSVSAYFCRPVTSPIIFCLKPTFSSSNIATL